MSEFIPKIIEYQVKDSSHNTVRKFRVRIETPEQEAKLERIEAKIRDDMRSRGCPEAVIEAYKNGQIPQ